MTRDTRDRLRDELARRYLVQGAQFDGLLDLGRDVALLEALRPGVPRAVLAVPALGYFLADGAEPPAARAESATIAALRDCVERTHGVDFLARRIAETRTALASLRPSPAAYRAVDLSPVAHPAFAPSYSERYLDLFAALQALQLVRAGAGLRSDALRRAEDGAFALEPRQASRLAGIAGRARGDLCALLASSRPGAGPAMLVGMARLEAMEESVRRGEWVVLDVHPWQARHATLPDGALRDAYLDTLERESLRDLARSRQELLAADGYREAGYAAVENAANRALEARAARRGASLRLTGQALLPARAAARADLVAPSWSAAEGDAFLAAARTAEARLADDLGRLYAYDLLTRNCVSEIFAVIEATFPEDAEERLGGRVATSANLNFIPLVSENAVASAYDTRARFAHPSYRERELARMRASEGAWPVALRESNTVTSTSYRRGSSDSEFLFFTQEQVAARPLLGAANLVWGLGHATAGLVSAPIAGPGRLERGLRGIAFSLPELFFVNLRKGTTAYAARTGE